MYLKVKQEKSKRKKKTDKFNKYLLFKVGHKQVCIKEFWITLFPHITDNFGVLVWFPYKKLLFDKLDCNRCCIQVHTYVLLGTTRQQLLYLDDFNGRVSTRNKY